MVGDGSGGDGGGAGVGAKASFSEFLFEGFLLGGVKRVG